MTEPSTTTALAPTSLLERDEQQLSLDEISSLLPFLLRPENVAHYVDGVVRIADRRVYPFEQNVVECRTVEEVAQAIEQMVTQGSGPRLTAMYGLVVAGRHAAGKDPEVVAAELEAARDRLIATRPTNTAVPRAMAAQLEAALPRIHAGEDPDRALLDHVEEFLDVYYRRCVTLARYTADLIEDGDGVLTVCFAETAFALGISLAREAGKDVVVWVSETRPYLQGARLTAPSLHEMGIPVRLISDNMPAHVMSQGKIQRYFSAADVVTMDGHVVNKIGTFPNAIAAHFHGIPYFAITHGPDPKKASAADCKIEERDPEDVRTWLGRSSTVAGVPAYYPAFDVTPPHLVTGVITEAGVLSPAMVRAAYGAAGR